MNWRPKNWKNPYTLGRSLSHPTIGNVVGRVITHTASYIFESGADEILEALKKQALYKQQAGWLVFIPKEVKE